MQPLSGLELPDSSLVCKLNKSLYGLKQTSRQWYAKLSDALRSRGYTHSLNDYSLFYRKKESSIVFIVAYIDDIFLTGTDIEEINNLKEFLHNQFKIKDLGKLHYFLGMEILCTAMGVIISQRKFVLDLLKEYQCTQISSFTSPLDATIKLRDNEG